MEELDPSVRCGSCGATYKLPIGTGARFRCGSCDAELRTWDPTLSLVTGTREVRYLYPRRLHAPGAPLRRFGRFTLHDEIGRGGMGVVYRAWDGDRGRFVALKVLLSGEHSSPEHVERFLREAGAAAKLHHPNVVGVDDSGWIDERAYFTMDLVEGPSLQELLEGRGALDVAEALRIAEAVARGLGAAHAVGVVHRDVKPGNLLLAMDGTPKVTDFGLAADLSGSVRLTRTGQLLGTPAYMAPEQTLSDAHHGTAASDQYALGAVLYEMLAGQPPYTGAGSVSILRQVAEGPPAPIERRRSGLSAGLSLIVQQAMARDPRRRYPDMLAFADDLGRCRRGEPVRAQPPIVWDRIAATWTRWRQQALGAGIALMLALVAMAALSTAWDVWLGRAQDERERAARQRFASVTERVAETADPIAAAAELEGFASARAYRDTLAASAALLERARLLSSTDGATEAWADAYAGARGPSDQDRALRGLAAQFRGAWRWESLLRVIEVVDRSAPAGSDPQIVRWQAQALLASGRARAAADIARKHGLDDAPLLYALSQVTRVDDPLPPSLDAGPLLLAAVDGPRGPERWWWRQRDPVVRVELSDGPHTFTLPVAPVELVPVADAPGAPMVVVRDDAAPGPAILYRLGADGPEEVVRWDASVVLAATAADLDRDGAPEVWVGLGPYQRSLVRVRLGASGAADVDRPVPAIDAAGSDVTGLAAVDTDGDGRQELVLTLGPWAAYDVRVVAPVDGGFAVVAREKLGHVESPTEDAAEPGAVWVSKSDRFASRVMFPANAPFGEAPGLYRLRRTDGGLAVDAFVPSPLPLPSAAVPTTSRIGRVFQLDLDGDGISELVFAVDDADRRGLAVVPRADPSRPPWLIGGAEPLAVVQADADPNDELLVEVDGAIYALGAGDGALPSGAVPIVPSSVPPLASRATMREWTRAEELVGMGLYAAALGDLVALAETLPRSEAVPATLRAAALAERLDDDGRAAALYAEVDAPSALTRAAGQHLRGHRFADALTALERATAGAGETTLAVMGSDANPIDLAALRSEVAATRTERLALGGTAGAPVVVTDPVGVNPDPHGGLRVFAFADADRPAIAVPFTWDGRRLGVDVELELQRLEWASGLSVRLAPVGANADRSELSVGVTGWGGGERLERELGCSTTVSAPFVRRSPAEAADVVRVRLSLDLSALTGDIRCTISAAGADALHANLPLRRRPASGAWILTIGPSRHGGVSSPASAVALVRELALVGTGLQLGGPAPRELATSDDALEVGWMLQAARDGRTVEAVRRARALPRIGPRSAAIATELAHALRVDPASLGPVLRTALGMEAFSELFDEAFAVPVDAHPDDPVLTMTLTTALPDIEVLAVSRDPRTRARAARLLAARGRAWAALGEPAAARRDLLLATQIGMPEATEGPQRGLAAAWVALAAVEVGEGDEAAGLDAVRSALEASEAPEIVADMVRASPALTTLASADPSWRAALGAGVRAR